MMFGVVFRVIGSKVEESWFFAVFGLKDRYGLLRHPFGIWSKISFKFAQTFVVSVYSELRSFHKRAKREISWFSVCLEYFSSLLSLEAQKWKKVGF